MGLIKLLAAPIRSLVRFPLFQLAVVVAVITLLQAADDRSAFGQIFNGLDKLVELYRESGLGDFQREVLHEIMAHIRLHDCVCLPRVFDDPFTCAVDDQSRG